MLIACVQSDVTFADPPDNLTRVLAWMEQARRSRVADSVENPDGPGADLVVFPECMLTGYTFDSRAQAMEVALRVNDPIFERLIEAAGDYRQFLTIGFLERDGDRLFNASVLVGSGGIVGHYRKIHLPGLGVDRFVDRGDRAYQAHEIKVASVGDVRVGMAICYDGSFPEPIRVLGLSGADIVALGTNWPVEGAHAARIVPPARSMENHLYFVAANRVGVENGFRFCGGSSICGPDGKVLAACDDDRERLLIAEVEIELARNKTIQRTEGSHVIDRFADRCPDYYQPIVEPVTGRSESRNRN